MIIDGSIAGFYLPGPSQAQDQPRPQYSPQHQAEQVLEVKPVPRVLDPEAYEKLRSRLHEDQGSAVQREGLSSKARRALDAYGGVSQTETRAYATDVLGLDVFA